MRIREGGNTNLPNLLGEYDCGDEPEEQDDSADAGSDGNESGESENDINDIDNENEEIVTDSPEIKQEGDDQHKLNQDLDITDQEDTNKGKPTLNLLE